MNRMSLLIALFAALSATAVALLAGCEGAGASAKDDQTQTRPAPPPRPGPLILGIRPEHLVSNGAAGARLTLRVDMVEALGADSYAYGEGALPGTHLVARLPGGPSPTLGTILPFTFAAGHVHWFDPATGKRIP